MGSVRVDRFYLSCLAHASYMISSEGVAAVIDPQRDVDLYLEAAEKLGVKIKHIIETHLHADFVSGHRELAERTGANIYIGEGSGATFPHTAAKDGDLVEFGSCRLKFLHAPGHTLEGVCVLLKDTSDPNRPAIVFTGDTLFIGDVGRPDLAKGYTPQQLASLLYRSLHEKLLTLPDETEVMPAHGAGSLCGKNMSSDSSSTIGRERKTNYALQTKSEDEFVQLLTGNLPPRPEYFIRDVEMNRTGASSLSARPQLPALSAVEINADQSNGVVVLDTRSPDQFGAGHVPGSINVPLKGQFASWAARILGLDTPIAIVAEDENLALEAHMRLARVGIENVVGYLQNGVCGWKDAGFSLDSIPQVTVQELAAKLGDGDCSVLDVREPGEVEQGAIADSIRIPLGDLSKQVNQLSRHNSYSVHCKSGYRSSIAVSILRRAGLKNVGNVVGGFDGWKAVGLPVTQDPKAKVCSD